MESLSAFTLKSSINRLTVNPKLTLYRDAVFLGEWPEEEVRKLHAEGLLALSDHYWRRGMNERLPLQKLLRPLPQASIFSKQT